MGYASQLHNMIFLISILILLKSSSLNAAQNIYEYENVSGMDEGKEKKGLLLEKFRALLGLKSLKIQTSCISASPSPSPSPIEAPAPAPAPLHLLHKHAHSHPPNPHLHPAPPTHMIQEVNKHGNRTRKILTAVLVPTTAAFVVCLLGVMLICCRFKKKKKKRSMRTKSSLSNKTGSRVKSYTLSSQNSPSKVSFDPGFELYYVDTFTPQLNPPANSTKQNFETSNSLPNHGVLNCAIQKVDEPEKEGTIVECCGDANSFVAEEIISVPEIVVDPMKCDYDGENIVPVEAHSSDDESFHSVGDSHSSFRLSNASANSLTDLPENLSPNHSTKSPFIENPADVILTVIKDSLSQNSQPQSNSSSLDSEFAQFSSLPPTPPPPPPPPPPLCSAQIIPRPSLCSSTKPNIPSASNLGSSVPKLSQTPQSQSPISSRMPSSLPSIKLPSIPPPPCPPPCPPQFSKGKGNAPGAPPPPPSQLPQLTPLGKDGAPLPKLKPLHWDKVRAAPDRSMVWDKLRSSSFE
ncbi:hypothetical protein RJ641_020716 [Dillenia turbinata]|uniref:FH2 domain-containing protein n=1 Tax=Dillenia turbinata TaxID=194707 RepID=A0AAN8YUF6_9MAGN